MFVLLDSGSGITNTNIISSLTINPYPAVTRVDCFQPLCLRCWCDESYTNTHRILLLTEQSSGGWRATEQLFFCLYHNIWKCPMLYLRWGNQIWKTFQGALSCGFVFLFILLLSIIFESNFSKESSGSAETNIIDIFVYAILQMHASSTLGTKNGVWIGKWFSITH